MRTSFYLVENTVQVLMKKKWGLREASKERREMKKWWSRGSYMGIKKRGHFSGAGGFFDLFFPCYSGLTLLCLAFHTCLHLTLGPAKVL